MRSVMDDYVNIGVMLVQSDFHQSVARGIIFI